MGFALMGRSIMRIACAALMVAGAAATMEVVGSCGSAQPSKVQDCQNVDMGSCGNACCKLEFTVEETPEEAMMKLNSSLAGGGPDGNYKLQLTAEGTLGFGDLSKFHIPDGVQYIGQVHHFTSGPKHYEDTIDFTIYDRQPASGSSIHAFSLSLIGGAYGDNGQNYKNIVTAMKAFGKYSKLDVDHSCPAPKGQLQQQEMVMVA